MRALYESIDRHVRLKIIRWGFLVLGMAAMLLDIVPLVWAAWGLALATALLAAPRRWLCALWLTAVTVVSVLIYRWLDGALIGTRLGGLPHARDFPHVVPYAGMILEIVFAAMASIGAYNREREGWQFEMPFSSTHVPYELRRQKEVRAREERAPDGS